MAEATKNILLGAAISLIGSVLVQLIQGTQQQTFQRELTARQEQFQRELTARQEQFQEGGERRAAQRSKSDRTFTALENYEAAFNKGSTQLLYHTAELTPEIGRVAEQNTLSYEDALNLATRYEQIVSEMNDWLGETGPRLSQLEILAGRKGPTGEFTSLAGLPHFIDRNDPVKRKQVVTLIQQQIAKLQPALLRYIKESTAFMDAVQNSLTEKPSKAAL